MLYRSGRETSTDVQIAWELALTLPDPHSWLYASEQRGLGWDIDILMSWLTADLCEITDV